MPNDNEMLIRISALVAEVLGLDAEEVSPEQNFFHDLGGESIDVLDLQFRIEKELGVRMQFREMFSPSRWSLDEEGRFTEETRSRLGEEFPFLRADVEKNEFQTPYDVLTIERIAQFVELAGTTAAAAKS